MNNNIDQTSGAVRYYGVKINGMLIGGQFLNESLATDHGQKLSQNGDTVIVVPVTSNGTEILLG